MRRALAAAVKLACAATFAMPANAQSQDGLKPVVKSEPDQNVQSAERKAKEASKTVVKKTASTPVAKKTKTARNKSNTKKPKIECRH